MEGWSARLPSGNVDNRRIMKTVDRMELRWRAPPGTLGEDDLSLGQQRNALAHSFESFEAAGTQFNTADLGAKLGRIRTFVDSLLEALQTYGDARGFECQAPGSSPSSQ